MTAGASEPKFTLVFFDVDSTLVAIEGIDVLSGGNPEIARLTDAAMNGDLPLDQVYAKRLEMIRPSREAVDALGRKYAQSLVDGAPETIARLQESGAQVHLVTAGIAQAIAAVARRLNIPDSRVHAVSLRFTPDGNYAGFDTSSPLTKPGGKETVVRDVRSRVRGGAAFVGDGVSDLETKPAVDLFIGFGGVAVRPRVREESDAFVTDPDLRSVLKHLLGDR